MEDNHKIWIHVARLLKLERLEKQRRGFISEAKMLAILP